MLLAVNRYHENNGNLRPVIPDPGRPARRNIDQVIARVRNTFRARPGTSIRKESAHLQLSKYIIHKSLHVGQPFHDYKYRKTHKLLPADHPIWVEFCNTILECIARDPQFPFKIIFSDEVKLPASHSQNTRNVHYWAQQNPHVVMKNESDQHQFGINMWIGIIGDKLVS